MAKSFSAGKITLTWTDPSGIGGGSVRVYHNAGSASNQFVDYSTVIETIAAGTQTWTSPVLADGVWAFGLRASDGTIEEINTLIMASIRIEGGLLVGNAPTRPALSAETEAGGKILLRGDANPLSSAAKPDKIKFFTNDGAGGAVDYNVALGAGFINLIRIGGASMATLTTIAFGSTARIFGMRAYTVAGVVSQNAIEFTITPVTTTPPQPLTVAGAEGRN